MTIVASLLLAGLTCTQPASDVLLGRWESHEVTRGGIGKVIDFRDDGTFVTAISVIVRLHYDLDGDILTVTDPAGSPGSQQPPPTHIRFEGDKFLEVAPGGSSFVRDRVGEAEPGKPIILGVWRYRHYTGGIAFERYTEDGNILLRLPMKSSTGCYLLSTGGTEVVLTVEGEEVKTVPFRVEGTQLKIQTAGRPAGVYDLSPWGSWYDIDNIDIQLPGKNP